MKIIKGILVLILTFIMLFAFEISAFAANTESVKYTREFPSYNGSIILDLSNVLLDTNKQYEFSIVTDGSTPTDWIEITEFTENTVKVNLDAGTTIIKEFLRKNDIGFLYIREKDNESGYIVENLSIDLKLPYMYATGVKDVTDSVYEFSALYGMARAHSYTLQKITDKTFIEQYLDIKNNKKSIYEMQDTIQKYDPPTDGYTKESMDMIAGPTLLLDIALPKDGLYIMWVKNQKEDSKTIYGAIVYDGNKSGTKLSDYINVDEDVDERQDDTDKQNPTNDDGSSDSKKTDNSSKPDKTTATKTLPKTGKDIAIFGTLALIVVLGIAGAAKYFKYRDVK